ncbi:DsbA family protein [Sciscionella sediminilitoris]|uniref:DsbA family protein n=1 Tax=Sciscionella sediminilitoris TaxID=1445613 RepID=UPI0004DFA92D|nr:thioredoxin domain-containing protein [Sciscionella sp. SE31]
MSRTKPLVRRREFVLIAVLVVVAVGLALYLVLRPGAPSEPAGADTVNSAAPSSTAPSQGPLAGLAHRTPGDPLAIGRPDAPVVLVEYSDYRCPFCAQFGRSTEPELVKRYVDKGKLRIEWRDFPIFGEQSEQAAMAGRAAAAQGRFWQFNKAVFEAAPQKGHPDLPKEKLLEFARTAGVPDLAKFEKDMTSREHKDEVQFDATEGNELGIPSTPAFVINGKPLLGAQPIEEFTKMIDAAGGK